LSRVLDFAVVQYVKCAIWYTTKHKGGFPGPTADEVLCNVVDYGDFSRYHELADIVIQRGEDILGHARPKRFHKCRECRQSFRKRAGETLDEFEKREKCYRCERTYTKECEACGETYQKEPRRSLKSWEASKFCSADCRSVYAHARKHRKR